MTHPTPAAAGAQFRGLFRSLVLDPELLFGRVLSTEAVSLAIADEAGPTRDRIFTPPVTLATFLSQVHSDDHSTSDGSSSVRPPYWRGYWQSPGFSSGRQQTACACCMNQFWSFGRMPPIGVRTRRVCCGRTRRSGPDLNLSSSLGPSRKMPIPMPR